MSKMKYATAVLMMASVAAYAEKDRSFTFENNIRIGQDDNVYMQDGDEQDSMYIMEMAQADFRAKLSSRSMLELYYSPEFRYRDNIDTDTVSWHDLYASLSHEGSEISEVKVTDLFRIKDDEGFSNIGGVDRSYMENKLQGVTSFKIGSLDSARISASHEFRSWDDSNYGTTNDYSAITASFAYERDMAADTTKGSVGVLYSTLDYDLGSRGGYDSIVLFCGADHTFRTDVKGSMRLGYQAVTVDAASKSIDKNSPYFQAGLSYKASQQTEFSGELKYSSSRSTIQFYNVQETVSGIFAVSHNLSSKIQMSLAASLIHSAYEADNQWSSIAKDIDQDYVNMNVRASYRVNRNNFVDVGLSHTSRDNDYFSASRNRFDIGWRLKLQ